MVDRIAKSILVLALITSGCHSLKPSQQQLRLKSITSTGLASQDLEKDNPELYCSQPMNFCKSVLTASGKRYNTAVSFYESNDLQTALQILNPNLRDPSKGISFKIGQDPMDFDKDGTYASSYNLAGLIQWKLGNQANAKQLWIKATQLNDNEATTNLRFLSTNKYDSFVYRKNARKSAEFILPTGGRSSDLLVDVNIR